jgi:hypothetical protein
MDSRQILVCLVYMVYLVENPKKAGMTEPKTKPKPWIPARSVQE